MARLFSSTSVETTLASGISNSATTITVATGTGSGLVNGVTIGTGNQFTVAIDPDTTNEEIVFITQQATDTFTITRARAGSSAVSHSAGATVRHVLTSDDLDYFNSAVPAAIVDAKGDLITATSDNTPVRLAVGTNNQVLTADSTTATGLKWASPSPLTTKGDVFTYSTANARLAVGANNTTLVADSAAATGLKWVGFQGCSLRNFSTQTIASNDTTWTSLDFDIEDFDTDSFHSTSTNITRITIPSGMAGKYRFSGVVTITGSATGFRQIRLLKNGGTGYNLTNVAGTLDAGLPYSLVLDLAVSDYIELQARQNSGSTLNTGQSSTWFQAEYLGA